MEEEDKNPQLEKIIEELKKETRPDKNFEQMLKFKLSEKFQEKHEKSGFFSGKWKFKTQLSSALLIIFCTSTTLYAYNNDSVTNGNILYPVKRSAEQVEGIFANTPEQKTQYYNKMAKRRMNELTVLKNRGQSDETTAAEAKELIGKAETEAQDIPEEIIETNQPPEESVSPQALQIVTPVKNSINLAEDQQAVTTEIVRPTRKKTKRDRAIEEITKTREKFETDFDTQTPEKDR